MRRPSVSVVMPFAGSYAAAQGALEALRGLDADSGDELILVDNCGLGVDGGQVIVVAADGERSPSHARNVGAERATRDWVLFLDADCRAMSGLIESYFARPIDSEVGALAGEVVPAKDGVTFAARYGAARSFLGHGAHLSHSYLPRAVAANLLVRRLAFDQIGGFYEGVRAAEDTDFSWRLQRAGWQLEHRPEARVEHRYRTTVGALRRQWRGYAAGRAWLGRRYEDFTPQPALRRAGSRVLRTFTPSRGQASPPAFRRREGPSPGPLQRSRFLALDALLGVEELAGLALSNRPAQGRAGGKTAVVLVADRFPARGDPLGDYARTLAGARVEAAARPEAVEQAVARRVAIDYREDDGAAARWFAVLRLVTRHPLRSLRDVLGRDRDAPGLSELAPAVRRLVADRDARVHSLGGDGPAETARRLAALARRPLQDPAL